MRFIEFLKEKIWQILLVFFGLITIEIFLMIYPIHIFIKIYIPLSIITLQLIGIILEYNTKRKFYKELLSTLECLDEKYLVTEIVRKPYFVEGKILKESLSQINKSMIEHINKYKYSQKDYKEYIELWIHEIKLPIATSKMIIENNKNDVTKSINEELDKVEDYTEQALYYARSTTVEKDYYIRKTNLKFIVNESIKKNKNAFIGEKIKLNLHDLDINVNTDSKWIIFILTQIMQNSIKYRNNNPTIEIYANKYKENVALYIKDNGIGIKPEEISRVFDKGFTGTNGRNINKKSTGIGLYLCKKLCDKLGISIELYSKENNGTEIKIIFPNNSYLEI